MMTLGEFRIATGLLPAETVIWVGGEKTRSAGSRTGEGEALHEAREVVNGLPPDGNGLAILRVQDARPYLQTPDR